MQWNGMFDCLRKMYNNQGFSGFYKGKLSPFLGNGAQIALQFGTNELVKKQLNLPYNNSSKNDIRY
jgi:solute carrier family 25 carnitine/acylcarnitine transporter 20/29